MNNAALISPGSGNWFSASLSRKIAGVVWLSMVAVGTTRLVLGEVISGGEVMALSHNILLELVSIVVNVVIILMVVSKVATHVLNRLNLCMTDLAGGDTSVEVPYKDRTDEIGAMAHSVQVFKENSLAVTQLHDREATEKELQDRRQQAVDEMVQNFSGSVTGVLKGLTQATETMSEHSNKMMRTSHDTHDLANTVATAADAMNQNTQGVSSAAGGLAEAIVRIRDEMSDAAQTADAAVAQAHATNQLIQGLSEDARKVGDVVALINDIAEQTNLLALNATIEAARAGDAGKGFAVVASEVKNLANQTARATDDISSQIDAIQGSTSRSVTAIGEIGETIAKLNAAASEVAREMEVQGNATSDMARNIEDAAGSSAEIAGSIQQVRDAADATGNAAEDVMSTSNSLRDETDLLRHEVENFLDAIQDTGERRKFVRSDVSISTKVQHNGLEVSGMITDISISGAHFNVHVEGRPGDHIDMEISGFAETIASRIAELTPTSTHIQFPLDPDHRAKLDAFIAPFRKNET
jgi:methyl-accepting chemotaxis protein